MVKMVSFTSTWKIWEKWRVKNYKFMNIGSDTILFCLINKPLDIKYMIGQFVQKKKKKRLGYSKFL